MMKSSGNIIFRRILLQHSLLRRVPFPNSLRRHGLLPACLSVAGILCCASSVAAQDAPRTDSPQDYRIKETVISARLPKRLRTYVPFWGTPTPSKWTQEDSLVFDNCVASIDTSRSFPNWICWNLDLASVAEDKYKFRRFVKKGTTVPSESLLVQVIDECYRWAWKKPYGNTNVVLGPVYAAKDSPAPSAWFVAVCKKDSGKGLMPLGFTSIAFLVPASSSSRPNLYDYSTSVNFIEFRTGYNLFPSLPPKVQEQVEEMTAYELFCPFQEIDENDLYLLEPEFEGGSDASEPFDVE